MGLETSVALAFIILVCLSSDNKTLRSRFDLVQTVTSYMI
jgi:hypothetical protein